MKIVIAPLADKTAREIGAKGSSGRRTQVRDANGHIATRYMIDFGSDTIDADLTYAFGRSIAREREENKRLTGSADGVVRKR